MHADTIIIGAGPAGLMAANELAKAGRSVLVLEARDRIGGRAHTLYDERGESVETGAEFVHGKLPVTMALLKRAGLSYTATAGKWLVMKGGAVVEDDGGRDWAKLMQKLSALDDDMPLLDFLLRYFPETKYAALKDRAVGYAEGYDSADAGRVSAKALYAEWSREAEEEYRIDEGYGGLMNFLGKACTKAGSRILLSHPVSDISLAGDGVAVTAAGKLFTAGRAIVALPLGVLQQEGAVQIGPEPAAYREALMRCGFGDVIKFIFRFREIFWDEEYPDLGFLMSGEEVPTWWTQAPEESPVLTGWMAGRAARAHRQLTKRQLMEIALGSLARIFSTDKDELGSMLAQVHIANWSADPYTRGAYAYATVGSAESRDVLAQPMHGRLYFAGEYMYEGPEMGTVEAALSSGQEVARRISAG